MQTMIGPGSDKSSYLNLTLVIFKPVNFFLTCPTPSHPQGKPCPSLIYLKYIIHISLNLTIDWQPNLELHRIWNQWYSTLCVTASIMLSRCLTKMFTWVRETRRVNSLSTCLPSGRAHCRVIITARSHGPKCSPSHKSDQVPTIQSPVGPRISSSR